MTRMALLLGLLAAPAAAQVVSPLALPTINTSALATKAEMSAVQASIPTPSATTPPAVSDAGTAGTMTGIFALANHTHASKARRDRVQSAADGSVTVTFNPAFSAAPICNAVAETAAGVSDVVNVQLEGATSAASATFRVTRTQRSAVALLGLTILSLPTQPGATWVHYLCIEK